ncbi:Conserved_hypothetical protein [Hexamita inflata]|uniref:Uncharacterized protein n=1 Tax=Hexamita inflata TaxID=28002 RepID=A0AA86RB46_9EUKA|nr:Conserved hypothetical protein [Hexamita inflata]CAI9969588.1 Conserved hypothetical protein [Hexamita inflata]
MQAGQCICETYGAFILNSQCTCGINSFNISNTCSCPIGANLVNGICTCVNINSYIYGNQCICPTHSQLLGDTCKCPYNSSLINNVCICDQNVGQYMINGSCQCPSGQQIVNNICQQTNYIINNTIFQCSQQVFSLVFDIFSITNVINSENNFSSGYVFNSIIPNSFIDISDNVYTTLFYPLFQLQSSFINLKIQLGTQNLNTGSFILSSSTSLTINQINIISKTDSYIILNAYSQLNILTSSSTNTKIKNLQVNLNFANSNGNITLIGNIHGSFDITEYQVLGSYISTLTVALIALNVNTTTANVDQVNFKPSIYNVGNGSSYLFSNAISSISALVVNNVTIILGNISYFQLLGSIETSDRISNSYSFGGVITTISCQSTLYVNNILLDSYQKFSTRFVSFSGLVVGYVSLASSTVTIQNICLQQTIISTTFYYYYFGLIGSNNGNTSLQNAYVTFSIQGENVLAFGIIAATSYNSLYTEVKNIKTSINISISGFGFGVGSILGQAEGKICLIQSAGVVGGNIGDISSVAVGGFIGSYGSYMTDSIITILDSMISHTYIKGSDAVGGFIGICSQPLYLTNSKIQQVRLFTQTNFGIVAGLANYKWSYTVIGSSSISNFILNNLQKDCPILLSTWSVEGC